MDKTALSLILLSRNEEKIIRDNILQTISYLDSLDFLDNYEILICDKSEDKTPQIVNELSNNRNEVKLISVNQLGIGAAIKAGIDNSRYPIVCSNGMEIPTGFDFIGNSIKKILEGYDVIIATRGQEGFIDNRPLKRKFFSKCYNVLINIAFHLKISDTQSAITFRLSEIKKYRNQLVDDGPFLQTEILIYARKNSLKLFEMPTNFNDTRKDSKIKISSFSTSMLKKVIQKKIFLLKEK